MAVRLFQRQTARTFSCSFALPVRSSFQCVPQKVLIRPICIRKLSSTSPQLPRLLKFSNSGTKPIQLLFKTRQFSTSRGPPVRTNFVSVFAIGGVLVAIYILWKLSAFLIKLAFLGAILYAARRVWVRFFQQSTTHVSAPGRAAAADELSLLMTRLQALRGPLGVMSRLAPAFAVGVLARLVPKMAKEYASSIQASRHVKGIAFQRVLTNHEVLRRLGSSITLDERGGTEEVQVSNDGRLIGSLEFPIRGSLGEASVEAQYSYSVLDVTAQNLEQAIKWKDLRVELPNGEEIVIDTRSKNTTSSGVIDADYEVLEKRRK